MSAFAVVREHLKPQRDLALLSNTRLCIFVVSTIFLALTFDPAHPALAEPTPKAAAESAAAYEIQDLGELPQIADDVTVALNRDGVVAYWTRTKSAVHATVWKRGHGAPVGSVAGYPNSIAHAINRRGDIAGWMNTSENPVDSLSMVQGFIRQGERIQLIAGLGGTNSRVFGLSDQGAAVGAANLPGGARHAFLMNGSAVTDLGTLPAGLSSAAYAINNAGVIVGVADVDGQNNHAVSWVRNAIVDLGTLANGTTSSARAINDRGQIAGFGDTPTGAHAFLYAERVMLDLGTLGKSPSAASGINNRGDVVGASNNHAFLWRHGRMTDLGTLVPLDSNWTLLDAFSINDRGQIACSARRKGEPTHLLLLTPTQRVRPSTIARARTRDGRLGVVLVSQP
jgi:probable HAF family extracellular repeat protein